MMTFFKKKNNEVQNTPPNNITQHGNSSSEFLNGENNDNKNCKEQPKRLVPGGEMPKDQGKKVVQQLVGLLIMLVIQVGIPLALYYGLRNTIGVVYALVISGIPPFIWVIFTFIKNRKIDALGLIIALSFILSGVVSLVSGDERAALIRDSAVGAIIGGFFLITLIPINTQWLVLRPLTYIMAEQMFGNIYYEWTDRDGNPQQQKILEWQFEHIRFFRWSMRLQTLAWGTFLALELVACVLFVELTDMTTDDIVKYNNIINAVIIATMVTVSIIASYYGGKLEKSIGKQWTEENDFTEKFEKQQQQPQQQQYDRHDYGYDTVPVGNIV
ncbi:hypothetical protein BDA99DRAFT_493070 [Phascolomyces articulosus]|uniref:Uncharacterized protein n=1 Tax=Phascolomyces articulosus TaxID=60185 RepID=A0AAD5KS46_9FUNG|nr:hypothetical protein BDA99DRAFT_493070 [Phascolomyces articulosus]